MTYKSRGASGSLQGDIVLPEPVVDCAGVASALFCNLIGSPIPQQVQEPKALRREDMAVLHTTRSHLRARFMQPVVNGSRAHADSLRNVLDPHPRVIELPHIRPRKREPASVLLPTSAFLPNPPEYSHVVGGLQALRPHAFRGGTTREPSIVEPDSPSPDLCRVTRSCRVCHGQPVHDSLANSLTEQ